MNNSPKYEIPWELIADSFTGNLSGEEDYRLQQWLQDPENMKTFLRIRELWNEKTEDYKYFRQANGDKAWKALQIRMKTDEPGIEKTKVIEADFSRKKFIRYFLAIASVCIGLVAILWYSTIRNNPDVHITGIAEQKTVSLPDGSVISLHPGTHIEIPRRFEEQRTVVMVSGEADFDVVHLQGKPFNVELGSAVVKDIGTRFIIRREEKMIHVAVSDGKVAFTGTSTNETRELEAGSSVSFDVENNEFSSVKATEQSAAFEEMLVFTDTPLSDVIRSLQSVYGKRIEITDDIAGKRLTAKLYGMSFDRAIEVICTSLYLEYYLYENTYMIKAKGSNSTNSMPE